MGLRLLGLTPVPLLGASLGLHLLSSPEDLGGDDQAGPSVDRREGVLWAWSLGGPATPLTIFSSHTGVLTLM